MTQTRPLAAPSLPENIRQLLVDHKAFDIKVIDVSGLTSITDTVVVASGTSQRHLQSLAEHLLAGLKSGGWPVLGIEGKRDSDWVLVDAGDAIVHLMLPRARAFYNLEQLWEVPLTRSAGA